MTIRHNRIHDCTLGIWLDWQTQGTRVSRNLCYANNRDLFVEVSHGPYLVEHNILASLVVAGAVQPGRGLRQQPGLRHGLPRARRGATHPVPRSAQHPGGRLRRHPRWRRPLHRQHLPRWRPGPGLRTDSSPATRPSRLRHRRLRRAPGVAGGLPGARGRSDPRRPRTLQGRQAAGLHPRQRVRRRGQGIRGRAGATVLAGGDVTAAVVDEGAEVYLECQLPADFDNVRVDSVSGADLERVRFVDADFEEPDGTPVVLAADLVGADKIPANSYPPGPISALSSGSSRIRVW